MFATCLVSKSLQSDSDSDSVWEKSLSSIPSDYQSIILGSLNPIPDFTTKKELHVYLCHNPILIDVGRKNLLLNYIDNILLFLGKYEEEKVQKPYTSDIKDPKRPKLNFIASDEEQLVHID
ncbi:hypothetical protein CQW23_01378 [Capsicum baccatum]|uniref:Uncharacterized protein n=1 Tax=Capsicum baccatum TaxID=33114 RepID=A0A2G2XNE5_CAPBA|nr:hypothetical protein CQW23_01378 [Capsicum baccatum]